MGRVTPPLGRGAGLSKRKRRREKCRHACTCKAALTAVLVANVVGLLCVGMRIMLWCTACGGANDCERLRAWMASGLHPECPRALLRAMHALAAVLLTGGGSALLWRRGHCGKAAAAAVAVAASALGLLHVGCPSPAGCAGPRHGCLCEHALAAAGLRHHPSLYVAQSGQDRWLDARLRDKRRDRGVYVEFGARDGREHSNTFFFEAAYNWSGVLIEPDPREHAHLQRNRPNAHVRTNAVVCPEGTESVPFAASRNGGWSGIASELDDERWTRMVTRTTTMDCVHLGPLLRARGVRRVDFMTVDTEVRGRC